MSVVTKYYLLRHAEVEERYRQVFNGRMDMGLSPRGHEQAGRLADYWKRLKVDAIYASPMRRVRETMAPFGNNWPSPVTRLDDLCEVDFGQWTGLSFGEVEQRYQVSVYDWLRHIEQGTIPAGENGAQFAARIQRVLSPLREKYAGQTVAIFAHGGVIRMILALLMDLPLSRTAMFEIHHASLTEIDLVSGRGAELQRLNFTPWKHLP